MESWRSALLSGMSGLWEMWDSAPSQHSKRCPWLRGVSAGCGDVFSLSVPSACVRVAAAAAAVECCSWLVWEGKQQSLNLPGGCGTGAADSSHTLHCWQHSSTAQSLPNLASAYKQGLGSGLAEVSWWFTRFPWALYFPGSGPAFHSHCVSGAPTPGALGGGQKPARIFRLLGGFVKGFSAWPDVPTGLQLGEGGCAHSSLQHTLPMPLLGLPWPPPAPPAQKHSLGRCSESRRCNLSYFSRKKMPESSGCEGSVRGELCVSVTGGFTPRSCV